MGKSIRVAVIGHAPLSSRLPPEFQFFKRISDTSLSPTVHSSHLFKAEGYVWSEYGAWFENSSIVVGTDVTGLYHYRCVLNLSSMRFDELPLQLRYLFLRLQVRKLHEFSKFLIVGEPNNVPEGVWGHFISAHPESESILANACTYYEQFLNHEKGSARKRLSENQAYYPRNIFITDTNFGDAWLKLSFKIAVALDDEFNTTPSNRWGGFVLERIFSLYVEDFAAQNAISVNTVQQTYFVNLKPWLKTRLLRIRFFEFLRKHVSKG